MKPDRFSIVVASATLLVGEIIVVVGFPWWMAVVPAAAAAVVFWALSRRQVTELTRTRHQLTLRSRPGAADLSPRDLCERLERHGYQIASAAVNETGSVLGEARGALLDAGLRLRDRRAADELGEIVVRAHRAPDGGLLILLEADDTGPGLYEEMAAYLVADLAAACEGLRVIATNLGPQDRLAAELSQDLPPSPIGLALLS